MNSSCEVHQKIEQFSPFSLPTFVKMRILCQLKKRGCSPISNSFDDSQRNKKDSQLLLSSQRI